MSRYETAQAALKCVLPKLKIFSDSSYPSVSEIQKAFGIRLQGQKNTNKKQTVVFEKMMQAYIDKFRYLKIKTAERAFAAFSAVFKIGI